MTPNLEPYAGRRTNNTRGTIRGAAGSSSSTEEERHSHSPYYYPNSSNNNNNSNHPNDIVICEEDSDDGSLLRSFTVWRSNFSLFGDATRLRRTANTTTNAPSSSSTTTTSSMEVTAREPTTLRSVEPARTDRTDPRPPPHPNDDSSRGGGLPSTTRTLPRPSYAVVLNGGIPETPGVLVSKSNVPAHLVNKDTVILVRPMSPADAWMLTKSSEAAGAPAAQDMCTVGVIPSTDTIRTPRTPSDQAPPRPTRASKCSRTKRHRSQRVAAVSSSSRDPNHPDALPAIGEEGESKCSTVHVLQNQSNNNNNNNGDNRHRRAQNDLDGNGSNSHEDASSSNLEMGSFREQSYFHRSPPLSKNGDHRDENDLSSSFFTRTGAPDSEFRHYSVDVDPTDGDRAADLYLFSWARPHMRGFHLAWMSFFVAFFNWFAMTPLLSEIASSLDLTRKELFTSSVLALVSSAFVRIWIGPLNDIYGARWIMSLTLLAAAIPTALAGLLLQNRTSLYILRLFIGVVGSSFVTCQYWTVSMFTKEIAGTANALAAGWGNLGGGVAQVVMGSLVFPLLKLAYGGSCFGTCSPAPSDEEDLEYDRPSDLAWRTALLFPALLSCIMAVVVVRYGDDTPKGNAAKYRRSGVVNTSHPPQASPLFNVGANFKKAASNFNTILLCLQYGCCFGVELAMTQAATLYFMDEFGQSIEAASAVASIFGWMNLFARGLGGFCSDWFFSKSGFRGRLWCQVIFLVCEGLLIVLFSYTSTMGGAVTVMICFSIFLQAAEGSTFGIVPYLDEAVTGTVVGFVGAGGNAGGAIFAGIFVFFNYQLSFLWMGCAVVASAFLSTLVRVPGHCHLLGGTDHRLTLERRQVAKPPAIIFIPTPSTSRTEEGDTDTVDDAYPSTTFTI